MREGLRLLLRQETDLQVVADVGSGAAALAQAAETKPDIAIMDIHMAGMNGIEVTRQLLERWPRMKIIVLSAYSETQWLDEALRAGVSGYLIKINAATELVRAIRTVLTGQVYLCAEAVNTMVTSYRKMLSTKSETKHALLSDREVEVLRLTAEGLRSKEIAAQLNISLKTVETHRAHLMAKLGCNSVVALTLYAVREGIVTT
jgi:DNA-binding NarL/FixJ family response regulator